MTVHYEAEKTGRSTVGETWEDEAKMDDELQLNIKGKRQSTAGGKTPQDERHSDGSDKPFTTEKSKKTIQELHPQMSQTSHSVS